MGVGYASSLTFGILVSCGVVISVVGARFVSVARVVVVETEFLQR